MSQIVISGVSLSSIPSGNQTVTVRHRLTSDPDIPASYTTDSTNTVVQPNGQFVSPVTIGGLLPNTTYTVWIQNNCGGAGFKKNFTTPAVGCPEIVDIDGLAQDDPQ